MGEEFFDSKKLKSSHSQISSQIFIQVINNWISDGDFKQHKSRHSKYKFNFTNNNDFGKRQQNHLWERKHDFKRISTNYAATRVCKWPIDNVQIGENSILIRRIAYMEQFRSNATTMGEN